jgi:hypothetical protein
MKTINYNGNEFPVREFVVKSKNTDKITTLIIAPESIEKILIEDDAELDDSIYCYAPDENFKLPSREFFDSLNDEEYTFVIEDRTLTELEKHDLIATFMGHQSTIGKAPVYQWNEGNPSDNDLTIYYTPYSAKYNSRYSWIMPVVEKIQRIKGFENWLGHTLIKKSISVELVFDSVVEFLIWYTQASPEELAKYDTK